MKSKILKSVSVAYMQLTPNKHYEFKFKIKNQYLVD